MRRSLRRESLVKLTKAILVKETNWLEMMADLFESESKALQRHADAAPREQKAKAQRAADRAHAIWMQYWMDFANVAQEAVEFGVRKFE